MNFGELDQEEREVLAIVDDWLNTTPEVFGDDEPDFWFDTEYEDDFFYDED